MRTRMRTALGARETGSAHSPPVLLTREKGKNDKLRRKLEERGVTVIELPCIQAVELEDAAKLPESLGEEWEWVVVTSPEGAKILAKAWHSGGRPNIRVAAVGAATAKIIEKEGISDVFVPSKAHAKDLAAELPDAKENGRILYPVSKLAKDELQVLLGERGFEVQRFDTYTTEPADWTEEDEKLAASARIVTFGSPSAVRVWAKRAPVDTPIAVCIGGTSARACESAGFARIEFPSNPGVENWANEVLRVLDAAVENA